LHAKPLRAKRAPSIFRSIDKIMAATPAWPPRSAPRLFVTGPLAEGGSVAIEGGQAHYLSKVMRVAPGDAVILCEDTTGVWACAVTAAGKREITLEVRDRVR
jgi:16S rRNA (uracil1498-N3)-methyltransferase